MLVGDLTVADVLQETRTPNLQVITAGRIPPNPSELLGSQRMHALVDELSQEFMVILDAPPLLPVTDAGLLTVTSDGALLVIAVGKTAVDEVVLCRKVLDQVGGRLLGGVLNMAPEPRPRRRRLRLRRRQLPAGIRRAGPAGSAAGAERRPTGTRTTRCPKRSSWPERRRRRWRPSRRRPASRARPSPSASTTR